MKRQQDKTGHERAVQGRARQGRTEKSMEGWDRVGQSREMCQGSDLVPRERQRVITAGSPSGIAATPSATAIFAWYTAPSA
jgi:hypothetical protein